MSAQPAEETARPPLRVVPDAGLETREPVESAVARLRTAAVDQEGIWFAMVLLLCVAAAPPLAFRPDLSRPWTLSIYLLLAAAGLTIVATAQWFYRHAAEAHRQLVLTAVLGIPMALLLGLTFAFAGVTPAAQPTRQLTNLAPLHRQWHKLAWSIPPNPYKHRLLNRIQSEIRWWTHPAHGTFAQRQDFSDRSWSEAGRYRAALRRCKERAHYNACTQAATKAAFRSLGG